MSLKEFNQALHNTSNKLNSHMAQAGTRTRTTVVKGQCSHHSANHATGTYLRHEVLLCEIEDFENKLGELCDLF